MRTRMRRGLMAYSVFPAEPEPLEHARAVVLDEEIRLGDELLHQIEGACVRKVQRQAALAGVGGQVEAGALPPALDASGQQRTHHAHAVGPARRLDMNDVGAERGEHLRRRRPGPPVRHVDHAQAREGQRRAPCSSPRSLNFGSLSRMGEGWGEGDSMLRGKRFSPRRANLHLPRMLPQSRRRPRSRAGSLHRSDRVGVDA